MATIPLNQLPEQQVDALRVSYESANAPLSAFGGGTARALQSFGNTLQDSSNVLAQRALQMQGEDNEYEAKALDIEFNTRARDIRQSFMDLSGKAAMDGYGTAEEQINKLREEIGKKATNEHVGKMFGQAALARSEDYLDQFSSHVATQRRGYLDSTDDAQVMTAQNDGAMSWMRPEVATQHYNVGLNAVYTKAERNGLSGEATQFAVKQYQSGFYGALTAQAISQDPAHAMDHLKKYQSMLSADDYNKLYTAAKAQDDVNNATQMAGTVYMASIDAVTPRTGFVATDARGKAVDAIFDGLVQQESAGNPGAVSPKGAFGLAQLMPDTALEMAKKLGINPSPENLANPEVNVKLGKAYLAEQLDAFDGNMVLALAAYNAGPGKVGEWIDAYGDPRTGQISSEEWARKIPYKETRDYIPGVMTKAGLLPQPMGAVTKLELAKANGLVTFAGMPQTDGTKLAKTQFEATIDAQINAAKAQVEENKSQAWGVLLQGGRFKDLPPEVVGSMSGETQRAMMEWDAKRDVIKTDPQRLEMLKIMRDVNPAGFATVDVTEAARYLDKDAVNWLITEKAKIKSGQGVDKQREAFMKIADEFAFGSQLGFVEADIKKKPDSDAAKDYTLWMNRAREVFSNATAKGQALSDTEMRQMLTGLSAQITLDGATMQARVDYGPGYRAPTGGMRDFEIPETDGPAYKQTLASIPKPLLSAIDQAIAKAGDDVNDVTRLDFYIRMLKAEMDSKTAQELADNTAPDFNNPMGN